MLFESTGPNLAASREFVQVVDRARTTAAPGGAIMPFHDDYAITADALPTVIHALRGQNSNRYSLDILANET